MPQHFTPPEYVETHIVIRLVQADMATRELIAEPPREATRATRPPQLPRP